MPWPRPRRLSAMCPPCVLHVSTFGPSCVVGFGRASSPCPPLVRLVLLALAAPPVLVPHLSATCSPNSLLWGSLSEEKRLAAICAGRVPGACPWCGCDVSTLATPPNLVRDLSAMWPPANVSALSRLRPQTLSTMCPPCVCLLSWCPLWVRLGRPPPNLVCPPFVRRVCLESALAASPHFLRHVSALSVRLASAMRRPCDRFGRVCPLSVRLEPALPRLHHVSALCPAWCLLWVLFRRNLAARSLPAVVRHDNVLVSSGPPCVQCPLKPWPCLWTALGAGLWQREVKFFLTIAQPTRWYFFSLVSFLGIHFGYPNSANSAFASAPYAWKTVWGLCWYNLNETNFILFQWFCRPLACFPLKWRGKRALGGVFFLATETISDRSQNLFARWTQAFYEINNSFMSSIVPGPESRYPTTALSHGIGPPSVCPLNLDSFFATTRI